MYCGVPVDHSHSLGCWVWRFWTHPLSVLLWVQFGSMFGQEFIFVNFFITSKQPKELLMKYSCYTALVKCKACVQIGWPILPAFACSGQAEAPDHSAHRSIGPLYVSATILECACWLIEVCVSLLLVALHSQSLPSLLPVDLIWPGDYHTEWVVPVHTHTCSRNVLQDYSNFTLIDYDWYYTCHNSSNGLYTTIWQ